MRSPQLHGLRRTWAVGALATVAAFAAPAHATPPTHQNLPYAFEHFRQKLDIYLPETACGPLPVIMYIYGGGWVVGEKEDVEPYVDPLLERGFAIVSINYRYSYQAIFPAQIHDCKAALRWVKGNAATYGLDPDRIAVFGESAGGHLSALVGTSGNQPALEGTLGEHLDQNSQVAAVGDFYGPTDLLAFGAFDNSPTSITSQLFGHPIQDIIDNIDNPDYADLVALVQSANPGTHVDATDPPTHIVHGDMDDVVPISQSQYLHDVLAAAKVPVVFDTVPGAEHEVPWVWYETVFDDFAKQLDAHPPSPADINCDGRVGADDLLQLISHWGPCETPAACPADISDDGVVGVADLLAVITAWGAR